MRVLCLTALLVVLSSGSFDRNAADEVLLKRARLALKNRDEASAVRFLRGWASLRPRALLPAGLEKEAGEAVSFAERSGRLRLYGSWQNGEVRVAVNDPAEIVSRVNVWATTEDGSRGRLTQSGQTADGRAIYRIASTVVRSVVLEAVLLIDGRATILARTELPREDVNLPEAPDPSALPRQLASTATQPPSVQEREGAVEWWWIVAGIAAAALTGLAVYEEVR